MQARTSRSTRSGAVQCERHPDHPAERDPAERDTLEPRARRGAPSRPCASDSTVHGRSGSSDAPWPGWSYVRMRKWSASAGSWRSHSSCVVPSELDSTTTGAPSGPWRRWSRLIAESSRTRRVLGRRAPRPHRDSRSVSRSDVELVCGSPVRASARSASRNEAALAASATTSCAWLRPRRGVRANETRSATTMPPLASRFARIRSASTSRPVTASAAAAADPPANASAPESASHSACQPPTARSCS